MYGRRTFTGLLASKGVKAGEKRVGESLKYVSPLYCLARKTSVARMTNPAIYRANYFGHKLHIDQNEKNILFGVTHICAVDGFSRKIVAFSTMPIKNNYQIYDTVYRYIFIICKHPCCTITHYTESFSVMKQVCSLFSVVYIDEVFSVLGCCTALLDVLLLSR